MILWGPYSASESKGSYDLSGSDDFPGSETAVCSIYSTEVECFYYCVSDFNHKV